MRVPIEGELDRGVLGEMLDVLGVRASRKQDRQTGMPESMPPDIGQTGVLEKRFEVAVNYILRVQGCTGCTKTGRKSGLVKLPQQATGNVSVTLDDSNATLIHL